MYLSTTLYYDLMYIRVFLIAQNLKKPHTWLIKMTCYNVYPTKLTNCGNVH